MFHVKYRLMSFDGWTMFSGECEWLARRLYDRVCSSCVCSSVCLLCTSAIIGAIASHKSDCPVYETLFLNSSVSFTWDWVYIYYRDSEERNYFVAKALQRSDSNGVSLSVYWWYMSCACPSKFGDLKYLINNVLRVNNCIFVWTCVRFPSPNMRVC